MNSRISLAVTLFLSLTFSMVGAQTKNDGSPTDIPGYRSSHVNSPSVPDGVTFLAAITNLISLADQDPEFAHAWIDQEMGLGETESAQLISLFRTTVKEITAEKDQIRREIGCITGVPRVYDDDTYTAFEQMDDAGETITESHYLRIRNQLDEDTSARLQAWVESQKSNTIYLKNDHKQLSGKIGVGGYERLEKMCQKLYAESQKETKQ